MGKTGAVLTVGIEGSFGILHYAVLAFTAARLSTYKQPLLTQDLLGRGFRLARVADFEDIVLKAQPADGSIQCRASTAGLISLLVDDSTVWSRKLNPEEREAALWLKAARTAGATVISGDHPGIEKTKAGRTTSNEPLVMARIPTLVTR
jgi:hypothetical protein